MLAMIISVFASVTASRASTQHPCFSCPHDSIFCIGGPERSTDQVFGCLMSALQDAEAWAVRAEQGKSLLQRLARSKQHYRDIASQYSIR